MQIQFDIRDDASAERDLRDVVTAPARPGDRVEAIALAALDALPAEYRAQLDDRDQAALRSAIESWIIANRTAISIGDTRQVELEFHLQFPPPREAPRVTPGPAGGSGPAARPTPVPRRFGRRQR